MEGPLISKEMFTWENTKMDTNKVKVGICGIMAIFMMVCGIKISQTVGVSFIAISYLSPILVSGSMVRSKLKKNTYSTKWNIKSIFGVKEN